MSLSRASRLLLLTLIFLAGRLQAQDLFYEESHALLIGVEPRQDARVGKERIAAATATFDQTLRAGGWETTVLLDPRRIQLEQSIDKFMTDHGTVEKSRLLLYFAGPTWSNKRGESRLLGSDGEGLAIGALLDRLKGVRARHLLLIINGRVADRRLFAPAAIKGGPGKLTDPAWISIVSGGGTPTRHFRSGFSFYLNRAFRRQEGDLDGDGAITARELGQYLTQRIETQSRGRWRPIVGSLDQQRGQAASQSGDLEITAGTRGGPGGASKAIPDFSWPPPEPSDYYELNRKRYDNLRTLGESAEWLERSMDGAGYRYSYYRVPGGFALAGALEQIRQDGTPFDEPDRWQRELPALKALTLTEMLQALVGALPGHYRVILFLVTDQARIGWVPPVGRDAAERWVSAGGNILPPEIQQRPLRKDYSISALVYHFQRKSQRVAPTLVTNREVPASEHLSRSCLIKYLFDS